MELNFRKSDGIKAIAALSSYIDSLEDDKVYALEVKEKKSKRSLNANSFCWTMIDKLAAKVNIGKTELYRHYIKEIGGVSETLCIQEDAVEKFCAGWARNGLGWQTDVISSKLKGCKNVIVYYGSSSFNTEQMSRLIDMIVQDCREQGINTMTERELSLLKEEWR